jgi:hypothetical protein
MTEARQNLCVGGVLVSFNQKGSVSASTRGQGAFLDEDHDGESASEQA